MFRGWGFARITADQLVHNGPVLFGGVIILSTAAGSTVKIYEGQDAVSGRLFCTFTTRVAYSDPYILDRPVLFDRGLYLDLGSNVTEVSIIYAPVPEDPPSVGTVPIMSGY